jgi:hypothetical protein
MIVLRMIQTCSGGIPITDDGSKYATGHTVDQISTVCAPGADSTMGTNSVADLCLVHSMLNEAGNRTWSTTGIHFTAVFKSFCSVIILNQNPRVQF